MDPLTLDPLPLSPPPQTRLRYPSYSTMEVDTAEDLASGPRGLNSSRHCQATYPPGSYPFTIDYFTPDPLTTEIDAGRGTAPSP